MLEKERVFFTDKVGFSFYRLRSFYLFWNLLLFVQLQTPSVHQGDCTAASGKAKGGGVCVCVNNLWCGDVQTVYKQCLPVLKLLLSESMNGIWCAGFWPLFTSPLRANSPAAHSRLYDIISATETAHPDAVFIVAEEDFSHCNWRTVLHKYFQHVNIPTHQKTLDNVYSNILDAYKAASHLHSTGHSDHISPFLYPAYRQRLKQTNPLNPKLNSGPEKLEASSWPVSPRQTGMCLKLQSHGRIHRTYRSMLTTSLGTLALV